MATAYCAWLRRQGVRVAPFKAQNMSNNALVIPDGGEIARAQAVQAEAAGMTPCSEMNPILLKPSGSLGSQLVLLGKAQGHCPPAVYYRRYDDLWGVVRDCLDGWRERCDVLVMEGAGSPVELNLMERDLVNLRPIRHTDGRWVLVGDIDRGGVYAQLAGTWNLLPQEDRARSLGAIVNKFRGDLSLFPDPNAWLAPHAPGFRILGTVPFSPDLRPDEEDGIDPFDHDRGEGDVLAWIRMPHTAILNDCQPWWDDEGVRVRWVSRPSELGSVKAIVIPGTKNTIADMRWLRESGMAEAILAAERRGALVVGICGGYQILGRRLLDARGVAGDAGDEPGLGLLPVDTEFLEPKILKSVVSVKGTRRWATYEIHMGRSTPFAPCEPLQQVEENGTLVHEGLRQGRAWGTYQHGWFEAPETRRLVAEAAGFRQYKALGVPWFEKRAQVYSGMADLLEQNVDMDPVRRYLGL
jgi:adenosylcobyric acid synthase